MGNCLVTKLKSVVNNNRLTPLGGTIIVINNYNHAHEGDIGFFVKKDVACVATIISDGTFVNGTKTATVEDLGFPTHNCLYLNTAPSENEIVISIDNKYCLINTIISDSPNKDITINIDDFAMNPDGFSLNHQSLYYGQTRADNITGDIAKLLIANGRSTHNFEINTVWSKVGGDISGVPVNSLLGSLICSNTAAPVYGNVNVYGSLTNLTNLEIAPYPDVTGSVEVIAVNMWNTTRATDSPLTLSLIGTGVTFHNAGITTALVLTKTGAGITITNGEGTTVATYNGSTGEWIYN